MHYAHDTQCDEQKGDSNPGKGGSSNVTSKQDKFGKTLKQIEKQVRWGVVQGKVLLTGPHLAQGGFGSSEPSGHPVAGAAPSQS